MEYLVSINHQGWCLLLFMVDLKANRIVDAYCHFQLVMSHFMVIRM
ncbi:MAG: hypothetical protein PHC48_09485 [Prevotella sp.]|nr:hypothetical protein [Prevotella sp.]